MAEFASNGKGNLGVTLGSIGTGLSLLNGGLGLLGNIQQPQNNGNNGGCSDDQPVTRYEMGMMERINKLESEKDALKSDQKTDGKILELYKYVEQQFGKDRENNNYRFTATGQQIADLAANQAVVNQRITDNLAFVDSKIDNVYKDMDCRFRSVYQEIDCKTLPLEKVVPMSAICPQPMQRYNSWTAPTETTPTTPAAPATARQNG